ncbi:MAG: MFS transporter [Candidatus Enteromonas sp.]|nr:MFS transporter [Candidatus Enteromonas sp.]
MNQKNNKLGARLWVSLLLIGMVGQIAWAIENNYINLWVFSQSHNTDHINWMTSGSAVVATITTFLVGAWSDLKGKRKIFISVGYTIWGLFVFLFGVMSLPNMETVFGVGSTNAVLFVGIMNLIVDCVMTFFGSMGNDAAFSAFVTDKTNEKNRPFVESVLSVMPLLALALMMLVGMALGIPDASKSPGEIAGPWFLFFLVFGALTSAIGVASFFLLPKDSLVPTRDRHYWKQMFVGFLPRTVKENPLFYLSLLAFLCFNIAVDAFLPYFLVYFQGMESFAGMNFYLAFGIIMGLGALLTLLSGAFLTRFGKFAVLIPSAILLSIGAIGLYFVQGQFVPCIVFGTILILGYLMGTSSLGASLRDHTPKENVGAFQSVRMVFAVMLPMVIGSNISSLVFSSTRVNDFGQVEKSPDRGMWIVVFAAAILSLIPIFFLLFQSKKKASQAKNSEER